MATTMKTPGVYIQELDAFGNSVVPVPTAVPAFIGYTAETTFEGKSLINKAVKVTSLAEFLTIFGDTPPEVKYSVTATDLPEREEIYQKEVDAATAEVAAAQKVVADVKAAGGTPTADQTKAVTDAQNVQKEAQAALAAFQKEPNIAALIAAQKALDAKPGDATLEANLKKAQDVFTKIINDASFTSKGVAYDISNTTINYRLYAGVKFFYENGGGDCYIMTVGTYDYSKASIKDTTDFMTAIELLKKETEPTMLLIPDAVEVADTNATDIEAKYANAYSLQSEMINHCAEMMSRVAVLDIPGGWTEPMVGTTSVEAFRNHVEPTETKSLSYASVYYPWLHTTVYQASEVSYKNIDPKSYDTVTAMLNAEFAAKDGVVDPKMVKIITAFTSDPTKVPQQTSLDKADLILQNLSKSYQLLIGAIKGNMNLISPASAMAGVMTSVDNSEGVWVAPANVAVQSTIKPSINISHDMQEDLNMPIEGKSVSAIRAFTGRGNLVWGARTMDGNSNDWRYLNVRRTLIYIEQSVKDAAKAYVFAPNVASTWVAVESLIGNFLTGLWNQGGLAGPKAADAFSVSVGLGKTMTNDDIQNGIMRVSVKVAISHPAEFIEITFQQEAQKG